jgi:hypothetical protein
MLENLGEVGIFLLEHQLLECGKTRETFTEADIEPLISGLKKEFSKIIGYGVEKLERDIREALKEVI